MANNAVTPAMANDSIPVIIAQEALGRLSSNLFMAGLVRRDYEAELARAGDTVQIPKRGALVVNDKAPGSDVTRQTPADTNVSVVLNKHKEVTFLIEDITRMKARPDLMAGYADDAATALGEQIDTDILAAINDGTLGSVGTAGTDVTPTVVRTARRNLNTNKAPVTGRHLVLSAKDEDALLGNASISQAFDATDSAAKDGQLRQMWGFAPHMSQLVATSGSAPVTTWNAAFHGLGIALVSRPMATADGALGVSQSFVSRAGVGIRVTLSYNADALAHQVTLDVLYGVKIVIPEFVIAVKG